MSNNNEINIDYFGKKELINQLHSEDLIKLAGIATNAMQLDQVAQATNINAKVVTAIIANIKVQLHELSESSLLNLAKLSINVDELCKIVRAANVW